MIFLGAAFMKPGRKSRLNANSAGENGVQIATKHENLARKTSHKLKLRGSCRGAACAKTRFGITTTSDPLPSPAKKAFKYDRTQSS